MSLGSIPDTASLPEFDKEEAALPPTQMVVDRPQSSFAEAFRRLRTSIHFARPDPQSTIIAVTYSLPGEGKTTYAICLDRKSVVMGQRVSVRVDIGGRRICKTKFRDTYSTLSVQYNHQS